MVVLQLPWRVDLSALGSSLAADSLSKEERRQRAVAVFEAALDKVLEPLTPLLRELESGGAIARVRPLLASNKLLMEATPEALHRLETSGLISGWRQPERAERPIWNGLPASETTPKGEESASAAKLAWSLEAIGAPELWRQGVDGRGIVLGVIDSGASLSHYQLASGFRGGPSSWLDPRGAYDEPQDRAHGHGTGVVSVAVGRDHRDVILGVAPGAQWIACAGVPNGRYEEELLLECMDWMLRVGQPDVLVQTWLMPRPGCNRQFQVVVEALRLAEILPVFAAGNHGPEGNSDRSPANYGDLAPDGGRALAVGAHGPSGTMSAFSFRGPSACGGFRLPSVLAPGEDMLAAFPLSSDLYLRSKGTSLAAGIAGGAAALLIQRFPEASVPQLERALRAGARGPVVSKEKGGEEASTSMDLSGGPGWGLLNLSGAMEILGGSVSVDS